MKCIQFLKTAATALALGGLIMPQSVALAAGNQGQPSRAAAGKVQIADVALASGGTLQGQVVDAQGQPVAGAAVTAHDKAQQVAAVTTGKDGRFAIGKLGGGNYRVSSGKSSVVVRAWKNGTAPPSARGGILLIDDHGVARGAGGGGEEYVGGGGGGGGGGGLLMLGAMAGIVTAGVIAQDDEDGS